MQYKYDLHIHSCLSPCADDDMSPANIAGTCHLCGLNIVSLTDHNSAKNLPAFVQACKQYNIKVLCGIEVCTSEEIHILCYFKSLETTLDFSDLISKNSMEIPNDAKVYGNQFVMDETDNITDEITRLLIVGCDFSVYEIATICHDMGGVCWYAHIDKNSFSVLSVLGTIPEDIAIDGVEIYDLSKREALIQSGYITADTPYMSNSDAHNIWTVGEKENTFDQNHPLYHFAF